MNHRKQYLLHLLASLRALRDVHRSCHWHVSGSSFYGDHLLFERLYDNVASEIDQVAERAIGLHGPFENARNVARSARFVHQWQSKGSTTIDLALCGERHVLDILDDSYRSLDQKGSLTLGLDDLLQSIASTHETHLYLLQQRS